VRLDIGWGADLGRFHDNVDEVGRVGIPDII
jgi:hypothetical protein